MDGFVVDHARIGVLGETGSGRAHAAFPVGLRTLRAIGIMPAVVLLLCASLLLALEVPSKPFLDKNSFFLSSAGFRVQVANDAAGKKAMHALPAHRFVVHKVGNDVRYLYAEPNHCACIFVGTEVAYNSYRIMLSRAADQPDPVSPDYKTQASALLGGTPAQLSTLSDSTTIADYLRPFY